MTFKEGSIVAEHYKLKRQLGQGSFGDVWMAHNLLADIDVAIKFYGTLDEKGIEEFRNEFKIAYRLHHPNLLSISHFDIFENCPYLVMPFCENGSVSHRIGQMPESEIWKFILDVSCGLAFLHNQNPAIVHQDIKPDNILITSDGRYVISDFGISRSFRTQMSRTNNKVNSSGTLAYMGPERFSEKPMIVLASDIWAFGMTLYEVITGNVLWEGMGGCVQLNGARIPTITGTTPELARLVSACLSPETWNRPTAQQIHDYAAAHIQHRQMPSLTYPPNAPVIGTPTPPVQPIQKPHNERVITPSPLKQNSILKDKPYQYDSTSPKPSSDNPLTKRLLMAAAALMGVIIIGAGAMYFHDSINEEQDFISCKTKQDFEQFIKDHPSSSYVPTARKRIEAMTSTEEANVSAEQAPSQITPAQATLPVKTIKKKIEFVERPTIKDARKPDDRIEFQQTSTKSVAPTIPTPNSRNDDDVFYACQTIGDYQSYLNTFPNGRHRTQAQAAINNLLGRNDNTANNAEPASGEINTRNAAHRRLPPSSYRNRRSSVRIGNSGHYGRYQRGASGRESSRDGGSSHGH